MSTQEEWSFEGPDYEVGIFGDTIVHEACEAEGDVEPAWQSDQSLMNDPDDPEWVIITTTYSCECGATTSWVERYPADHFETPRLGGDDE